ncbi:MAG TPA: DUF1289 domain-containing protein [Gammaproteobacteria bacterium]|nr:DUF1289 domain-containing protein [Gammaproteobacteria bacterium]
MLARMSDQYPAVASPCVRNCCLDDDDICIGCGRALPEIIRWSSAQDEERREILARSLRRQEHRAKRRLTNV